VSLPQLLPAVLSAAALVFLFCLLSFAVVLVLGGGPRYTTLEVEVYRLAKVSLDLDRASALALVGALLSLLFLYAYIRLQRSSGFPEDLPRTGAPPPVRAAAQAGGVFFLAYLAFMAW